MLFQKIIKDKLVNNLPTAPLYNIPLFTRHLESAYLTMYDRYQHGLDPVIFMWKITSKLQRKSLNGHHVTLASSISFIFHFQL